jgi:4-hydroxy-2-oxoheptanedioate aldolase
VQTPTNVFKQALRAGQRQIGLWLGTHEPAMAELLAGAGFDWLVFDAEHSPNDPRGMLPLLQAVSAYPVTPVVRPRSGATDLIKQYLDIGVQTLVIPMIETPSEAERVVAATRYPTRGHRGVASATTRAARWGRIENYARDADEQICVLVQVESVKGLENLEAIARVDGVDGVLFGPADLAASMGHLGRLGDPEVRSALMRGISTVARMGKSAGTLMTDRATARECLAAGALFMAVGVDMTLLASAASELAASFKQNA